MTRGTRRLTGVAIALALLGAGCGSDPKPTSSSTSITTASAPSSSTTTSASSTTSTTKPPAKPKPTTISRSATPKPSPAAYSLRGDTRNRWVFAPLSNPSAVTDEGSVPSTKAWSTSKVLIVAAYLKTVVGGDPTRIPAGDEALIVRALTASDMDAVTTIRSRIPGSPGAAINSVLRSVGDTQTVADDTNQGGMLWSPREQVRFMAALGGGRVVSRAASAYLLSRMHPIPAHRWGLGTIGATSFKGGWLRSDTVTRQMGIVDGYAVAIITYAVGPAVVQTDGDSAHVQQMNRLAAMLKVRLAREPG